MEETGSLQIIQVDPTTFEFQQYTEEDNILISSSRLDTAFTSSTDYIEYYAYDENQNLIYPTNPDIKAVSVTSYSVIDGDTVLYPNKDLEEAGYDVGSYYVTYNFYRKLLSSDITKNYFISEISGDRTEIRLKSTAIDSELVISSSLDFIQFREDQEYFVDFLLNFGNDQQCIANNIKLDVETELEPSILVKLYEPLPDNFDIKSTLWVVEEISFSQAYNVIFPEPEFDLNDFQFIQGPNYSLQVVGQTSNAGESFSYNTLVNTNLTSSYNQIKSLLNRKEVNISVDYTDYNEFVYFSSAKTRLENFYYKVGLIQSSSAQISASLGSITGGTTGSFVYSSSKADLTTKIENIIKNFDGYEYFLYFNSGSSVSYPKSTSTPPYALQSTGSAAVQTWITASSLSASAYDDSNPNYLYNAIPEYIREDVDNKNYELFVDMVAQQYDTSWLYAKNLTTRFDADNRLDFGISRDLVADAIKDFGIKLYSNNFNTDDLYTAFLGITPSGSAFPFPNMSSKYPASSGYERVTTSISASNDIVPLDNVNKSVYKRIYHNVPQLLKKKGTLAGLRALITSYGIPDTILRISEFGGKDKVDYKDWDFFQNQFNYALHLKRKGDGTEFTYVSSSIEANALWPNTNNTPQSIQFRFKTDGIPTSSLFQNIYVANASSHYLTLEYTGSSYTSGSAQGAYSGSVPSGSNAYGTLRFFPEGHVSQAKTASISLPFFDGGWWSVQASVDYDGNLTASLYAANRIGDQIGFSGSNSIAGVDASYWAAAQTIRFPSSSLVTPVNGTVHIPLSGAIQEIRYWDTPLSESLFYDYVVNPYSTQANTIDSTPEYLVFRADLGSQLNTGSRKSIHPKITGSWSITQSFANNSNFYIESASWLKNTEEIYYNQVPGGIKNRITEKVRVVNETLPTGSTLSPYRSIQQNTPESGSTPNINYLEVAFSPQNQINDDIISQIGAFNLGDYIGDPRQIFSYSGSDVVPNSYPQLDALRDAYFTKYITSYDVNDFVRLIKFFDNSLFKMIEDFTPARTTLSSGVVVKQNLLERNRIAPPSASFSLNEYTGSIVNLPRDYSSGSNDTPQYSYISGSSIYTYKGQTGGVFDSFNSIFNAPISNSGAPYSGKSAAQVSASYFAAQYPGVIQQFTESIVPGLGISLPMQKPSTQLSSSFGQAPQTLQRIDQREFYNGEFPTDLNIGNKEICKAFFGQDAIIDYFFLIQWFDESTFPEANFILEQNLPLKGNVWLWADTISNLLPLRTNRNMIIQSYTGNSGGAVSNAETTAYSVVDSNGQAVTAPGAKFSISTTGTGNAYLEVQAILPGSGFSPGDIITITQATLQGIGISQAATDLTINVQQSSLSGGNISNKIKYIKVSTEDTKGNQILPFIEDANYIIFNLSGAQDANGVFLNGFQTWYISNYALQDDNISSTENAVLLYINEPPSSTAVSSFDSLFFDLTFSASGQFVYYATSSGQDPTVLPNINFTQSFSQGYFPPIDRSPSFPTASFFKGWADASYLQTSTDGGVYRVSSGDGFYYDPFGYNNFNIGSKEFDYDPQIPYTASQRPWFMNATEGTLMALSASSLVGTHGLTDLQLYTGSITASTQEFGLTFTTLVNPTPLGESPILFDLQSTLFSDIVVTNVSPNLDNLQPSGNVGETFQVQSPDPSLQYSVRIEYLTGGTGWITTNPTLTTSATIFNGNTTFTVFVNTSSPNSNNTNLQQRTANIAVLNTTNPASNPINVLVAQTYYNGTGNSSGNISMA